ncbi:glycosyltransferase family 4 protein [Flavobacterium sp. GT3R68]|uniref:glycosyltransferase family 4 protein n=1 Tax=Flavobacterium sp. GT3R68 TaxID=2594437 RepID=UPI000F872FAA|nr:glycosyltransferase family 4 protein [Flavobacterium sp. GT3R68]RTY92291.1 glycosyltransferase family 1 protein [Flavobacterium sp. GSN2]TRW92527.1 glycosyltransferase family 4 protein [Flavobacterium sp. GT3R68]
MNKKKIIRTSTIAMSLNFLLKGQLAFLKQNYEVIAVSGADHHLDEVALREGVRTVNLQMQRAISPVKDIISLWKLYRLFKKEKPFIVHSITPKAGLLSMTAAYFAGVPVRMHTFTGLIFPSKTGMLQKILIRMDKLLCHFATNVYPEGEGVKHDLVRYKITAKPLNVLANGNVNGIDSNYFDPNLYSAEVNTMLKHGLGINTGDFVFIFVGRLVSDKGMNELVTAFKKLNANHDDVKLLLVGPFENDLDPLDADTLQEIKQHKNIISVGFQNDIRPYLAIADVLVFPSYREGFPNVVLQAGAMGLPAIVTDINGCNEIVIDNLNGIIIPAKDSKAVQDAMQKLLQDTDLRNHLQQQSRNLIISRYEQKLVWEALLLEYRKFDA